MSIKDLLTDPRAASAVSGTTVTSGLATWLDMVPNEIGKLATLVGTVLSLVMIYVYIQKNSREAKESSVQLEILMLERDRLAGKD